MSKKILVSAMKNEGPFILEWVAYHRAIGFDKIIICSNDSTDGTTELLDALDDAGEIQHVRHTVPAGVSAQGNAAKVLNEMNILSDGDWAMWLDADEFFNIHVGNGTVDAFIARLGNAKGMLVSWKIFGDSRNLEFGGRHISSDFTLSSDRSFSPNRELKSFFLVGKWTRGFATQGIHRPLLTGDKSVDRSDFLSGKGKPLDPGDVRHDRWLAGENFAETSRIGNKDHGWRIAQINHYTVRTPEYFALKRTRGRGWAVSITGKVNDRHTPKYYQKFNQNVATDTTILRWADAVTERISKLLENSEISLAYENCIAASAKELKKNADWRKTIEEASLNLPTITLPNAERKFVTKHYKAAKSILEYGSGGSTVLATEMGGKNVFSVESDVDWAGNLENALQRKFPNSKSTHIFHADIGPTKEWGHPVDNSAWQRFHKYPSEIWDQDFFVSPDVVLIDGRFRKACFATAALRITKPTIVLFDDYLERPYYHEVELLAKPVTIVGRMAKFELVPTEFPKDLTTTILSWFMDVS